MSCPEFITHPKRSTDLFNITQTRKIHYKQSRKKFCDEPYKTELTQTTYFKQWQEYFYLTFSTNTTLLTYFYDCWYTKFYGTAETVQTTHFNRYQEYFYLLISTNSTLTTQYYD